MPTLAVALCLAQPASAYLKFGVRVASGQTVLKWSRIPVRYFVADRGVPGVTAPDLSAAVARAFGKWQDVATASIAYELVGYTSARPGDEDGRNTLGFESRPDLDRVLASTSFLVDVMTGELLESDIFFNSAFLWSTSAAGEAGRYDLETIALHEIGHLSGLGHSAIGETELRPAGRRVVASESAMFPIAFGAGSVANRTLRADDIAGISDLYPDGRFNQLGSLSGRVIRNGAGVLGAHVVTFDPVTGALVGGFSLNRDGRFSIAGLAPGPHVVRVEPIDDADTASFFDSGEAPDVDFRVAFHPKLVVVPKGGDSGETVIETVAK